MEKKNNRKFYIFRNYDDRQAMFDEGVENVRPKLLESVWQAKFSAWMDDDEAGLYLDGKTKEEDL